MNIEDTIYKASKDLFEEFPLLESVSWVQYINEENDFIVESDDFTINEESYWGENAIWKRDVNNYLKNIFDDLVQEDLQALFGSNVKITITRNEILTSPYFIV